MKLYDELAPWFHLLTAPPDYRQEAELYSRLLEENASREVKTVLELGSGGGNNASHMKSRFELTLVDRSPAMLDVSRGLNPECEHLEGDMRTVRLGRVFDSVFVHDAVMYLTTAEDLRAAIATAVAHCRPGGVVLFVPDCVRETFHPYEHEGGHDGEDGRGLRYHERVFDPDPDDSTYRVEMTIRMREADGTERVETDHHLYGLFGLDEWISWLAAAGLDVRAEPSELGGDDVPLSYLFLGLRPVGGSDTGRTVGAGR